MMNSVAPFWDGNETWLVLGGGGLLVAFPQAYAVIMPALYLPVIIMLLALIFRGVAFEFRWIAKPRHRKWDIAFAAGSIVAAFIQGVVLGGLMQGINVVDGQFAGGTFDWLTPFSLMCGLGVVAGYALLGATWLVMKTEGPVEVRARRWQPRCWRAVLFMGIVSLWTPLAFDRIAERWFSLPNILYLSPVPLATLLLAWTCWRGTSPAARSAVSVGGRPVPARLPRARHLERAVARAADADLLGRRGVRRLADFHAGRQTLLLPMILGYTVFVYWMFRGKVKPGEGYH